MDIFEISVENSSSRIDSKIIIGYEIASPVKAIFLTKDERKTLASQ